MSSPTELHTYLKEGYKAGENPRERLIGYWLWWRTWASAFAMAAIAAVAFHIGDVVVSFALGALAVHVGGWIFDE